MKGFIEVTEITNLVPNGTWFDKEQNIINYDCTKETIYLNPDYIREIKPLKNHNCIKSIIIFGDANKTLHDYVQVEEDVITIQRMIDDVEE